MSISVKASRRHAGAIARVLESDLELPKNSLPQTTLPLITNGSDAWHDLFGLSTAGLPAPTRATAMAVTAIYACVNLIAGAIMALPVNIYRVKADGERDRIFDDPLHWILNEEMSGRWASSAGWEFLVSSLMFEGDSFAVIQRDRAGRVLGLVPIHPWRVTVAPYNDGSRLAYGIAPEIIGGKEFGEFKVYDQDDVLHVPGFGFDGLRGLSPLKHALRSAGAVAIATQDYAGRFFANSARPDYALQTDQALGQEAIDRLRKQIDEQHNALERAHRPMVLANGLKIQTWSVSASDMQLLQSRQFSVEEIARAYGVPPHMIGHTDKTTSWGQGVESMGKGFVRYTLRQHLHKFEVEINRKVFRTAARVAEFDTSDLERADTGTLMQALRVAVGRAGEPGIMRVNEARQILRLNKADGGDVLGVNPGPPSANPEPKPNEGNP